MWRDLGAIITRRDMAYWTNWVRIMWLQPLTDHLHDWMLRECQVIHADETRIPCNHEPNRKASMNSFMWVLVSRAEKAHKIMFFQYMMTRNGDHAKELLKDWHGSLINQLFYNDDSKALDEFLPWSAMLPKKCYRKNNPEKANAPQSDSAASSNEV